jgi:hypothetical protein
MFSTNLFRLELGHDSHIASSPVQWLVANRRLLENTQGLQHTPLVTHDRLETHIHVCQNQHRHKHKPIHRSGRKDTRLKTFLKNP